MNEGSIYIALYCVLLYTQSALKSCGGGLSSTTSTWMMRRQPQDNDASALTTHQLQVERRESHRANQERFTRSAMGFLMTTESQDLGFNVSSEKECKQTLDEARFNFLATFC